jgi:hypothetical protein
LLVCLDDPRDVFFGQLVLSFALHKVIGCIDKQDVSRSNVHCPKSFPELAGRQNNRATADVVARHTLWVYTATFEARQACGDLDQLPNQGPGALT